MKKLSFLITLLLCMVTHGWGASQKENITLTLKNVVVEVGNTYQLTDEDIVAKDAAGNVVTDLEYTCTSDDLNSVTVEGKVITGVYHRKKGEKNTPDGNANITVELSGESANNYKITGDKKFYVLVCKKIFTQISDLRTAFKNGEITGDDVIAIKLSSGNHGIIEYVNNADHSSGDGKKGDVFITDISTDYGLRIPYTGITEALGKGGNQFVAKDTEGNDIFTEIGETEAGKKIYTYTWSAGDTFTGTMVGYFLEGNNNYPDFSIGTGSVKYSDIVVDRTADKDVPTVTVGGGVHTLAKNNNEGDLKTASYADYLCTKVKVEGVIARNDTYFYLLHDETCSVDDRDNTADRIYFDNSQGAVTDDVIDRYMGTKGTFTGLLGKRNEDESMLILIDAKFMNVTELIYDENKYAPDLAQLEADGQNLSNVTVKIHRTGIKPLANNMWNTICLPITVTVDELNNSITSSKTLTSVDLATFTGNITDGLMEYSVQTGASTIQAGTPYLVRFNGEIEVGTDITDLGSYYFTFYNQNLTSVDPSPNVSGTYKSDGDTHFVGLYGAKTDAYSSGKGWQYISTTDNTLKYISAKLEYNGDVLTKNYMKGLRAVYCFDWWDEYGIEDPSSTTTTDLSKMISFTTETTGINGVKTAENKGDGKVYNLNGQCVGTSLNGLAKGVYIVNGKKYIAK